MDMNFGVLQTSIDGTVRLFHDKTLNVFEQ